MKFFLSKIKFCNDSWVLYFSISNLIIPIKQIFQKFLNYLIELNLFKINQMTNKQSSQKKIMNMSMNKIILSTPSFYFLLLFTLLYFKFKRKCFIIFQLYASKLQFQTLNKIISIIHPLKLVQNIKMADPILKMIQSTNPQQISNYIKNYLPNDPVNLQRIYNELLQFSTNFSQIKQKKQSLTRYTSQKNINKKQPNPDKNILSYSKKTINPQQTTHEHQRYKSLSSHNNMQPQHKPIHIQYIDKNNQQYINSRYNSLTRDLKDKGIHPNPNRSKQKQELSFGMKICKQQQDKIIKPLISNSKVIFNEKTQITDQIKRFNINKKFYQNDINDAEIDQEKYYDRKMKAFLDRRRSSLIDIMTHKNQIKQANNRKYPNMKSKLFQFQKTSPQTFLKTEPLLNLGIQSVQNKFSQYKKNEPRNSLTKSFTKFGLQNQITNNFKIEKLSQANILLDYCKKSLSKKSQVDARFKIDTQKLYEKTINKLSSEVNLNHLNRIQQPKKGQTQDQSTQLMIKKVKENFLSQFYDKYDGNYIKMVRNMQTQRTKKGILLNKKDLLKNEIMLRKIMKSSSKE